MTDEQMDARLRAAGDAWRSATTPTAEIAATEPEALTPPPVARPRRHRVGLLASAAAVVAALVAGGSLLAANLTRSDNRPAPSTEAASLEGTVWRFLGYGDQLQAGSLASFYISPDGQFVADDSCDLISGRVSTDNGQLFVTQPDVRYYNCVDSVGEVTFDLDVLLSAPSYTVGATGELTITGGGKTMHLIAAPDLPVPTADRPTVNGATWRLVKVTDPSGTDLPVTGDATLRIDQGSLRASDTCNTLNGSAAVDGNQLDTKNLAITEIGCPQDVMATAAVIDAVLSNSARAFVLGTKLTVGLTGSGTLEYEWVPDDAAATDPANLTDRTWQLTSLAGNPVGDRVTLRVNSDGTVTGYDGCRELDASGTVAAGTLNITGIPPADFPAGTCNSDLATTVDSLLTQRAALWHVDNGDLVVNGPGAQAFALVFQSADGTQPPLTPLAGTDWRLTTIESAGGANGTASSVVTQVTVRFDGHGKITVEHRCYVDTGDAQVSGNTLDISHKQLQGAIPCPATPTQNEEQQENQVVDDVLSGRSTWSMTEGQLRIAKDGVGALVFGNGQTTKPLVGTSWALTQIATEGPGSGSGTGSADKTIVLTIDGGGGYQLATGCHSYAGTATVDGSTITFADQRDLGGDDCLNTVAQQLVHFLDGAMTWSIGAGELTLTNGTTTATFTG